jgi:hypothetical protein
MIVLVVKLRPTCVHRYGRLNSSSRKTNEPERPNPSDEAVRWLRTSLDAVDVPPLGGTCDDLSASALHRIPSVARSRRPVRDSPPFRRLPSRAQGQRVRRRAKVELAGTDQRKQRQIDILRIHEIPDGFQVSAGRSAIWRAKRACHVYRLPNDSRALSAWHRSNTALDSKGRCLARERKSMKRGSLRHLASPSSQRGFQSP